MIHALAGLGFVAIHAGDFDQAEQLLHRSLQEARATRGAPAAATAPNPHPPRTPGTADAWRDRCQVRRHSPHEDEIRVLHTRAAAALGNDRAERAVADGGRLSPEEAVTYASRGRGERRRPPERSADVPEAGGAQTEPCNRYREAGS